MSTPVYPGNGGSPLPGRDGENKTRHNPYLFHSLSQEDNLNTQIPTDIAGYITNQFNSLRKQFDRRRRDFFRAGIKCIKAKRDTSRWEQAMTKWTTQRRADGLPEPTWLDHFVNEGHQREVDGPVVGLTTFREALTLRAQMILESNLDAKRDYLLSKNVDLLAEQIVGQIITEQSCTTETNIYLSVPYHTYSEHSFKQANEIVALVKAKGGKIACSVPFVAPQTESGDMRLMRAVFSDRADADKCAKELQARGYLAEIDDN